MDKTLEEVKKDATFLDTVMSMTVEERLSNIQNEMRVPKNLYNTFGKYNYRNAETIMEVAKPICKKYRCTLTVSDDIKLIGDRYYVVATACLKAWESELGLTDEFQGRAIMVSAFAREDADKKGMDGAQVTGSTSSYARKYALNGLFNLDDNKDPDTDEYKTESEGKSNQNGSKKKDTPKSGATTETTPASQRQWEMIRNLYSDPEIGAMLGRMGKEMKDVTIAEASKMIEARNK